MLFYKINATYADKKWGEQNDDRRVREERARWISKKTKNFNDRNEEKFYGFISELERDEIICGIFLSISIDVIKLAKSFFKLLGIAVKDFEASETTFYSMRNLLGRACNNHFIENDRDVLDLFDLDRITGYNRGVEYGENLIAETTDKSQLYETSKRLLSEETLCLELDRIYSGKMNVKAFGHPVHYIMQTDDRDTRKELSRTLLQALYDNGRIKSLRYCYIDFKPGQDFSRIVYDTLYKSCIEGAILVRYLANDDSEDDSGYASSEMETISALCEAMKKYRNQVLTVFCLPRVCEKAKKIFYENLGSVGIVEIKEDLADTEKSSGYLKMLCRDKHIRPDKKLFKGLESDKKYIPDELRGMFNEWYNDKMKTSVFPQYKDIKVCRKETVKEVARGNAYDDLNEMIGLTEAKSVINKALNYYRIQRIYKDKGLKQDRPAMHMVFTGNPGTAKTTVARLFARIMKENGLLSKGHLVEVGRGDLVGKYVGWTAPTVKGKFKEAMGGVLFIDEAYSLVEDRGGSFGDEAINTIVQEMENRRDDLVVIFAGYPDKMEEFLNKNPGLRSRIAFHVPFADYEPEELCDIARLIGKSKGITLTESAVAKLSTVFEAARHQPDFGNGRYVRNVIELSKMNQASRILSMDPGDVTESVLTSIEDIDIEIPATNREPVKRTIGFAS
jgi:hypothetical protein